MITISQMIDQKNIIIVDEFFELTDVIITRKENVIRNVIRDVTRKEDTRVMQ